MPRDPSHRAPVRDLPERVRAIHAHAEDRKQKIHALLDGGPIPLFQVAMLVFPDRRRTNTCWPSSTPSATPTSWWRTARPPTSSRTA